MFKKGETFFGSKNIPVPLRNRVPVASLITDKQTGKRTDHRVVDQGKLESKTGRIASAVAGQKITS